jgi:hypothetical protein
MLTHGYGPKDTFVRSYWRWQNGHLLRVKSFIRRTRHVLSLRPSDLQLSFGFA